MTSASSALAEAAQVTVTEFIPATARTFVTGCAQSGTAVADGDNDGDAVVEADAVTEADVDAEADVAAVGDCDDVGDADAEVLSFADDPAGTGVAAADDGLESAGDDGSRGVGRAVTSALELVWEDTGSTEPTRGATDGSTLANTGSGSTLEMELAFVAGVPLSVVLGVVLDAALDIALGVALTVALCVALDVAVSAAVGFVDDDGDALANDVVDADEVAVVLTDVDGEEVAEGEASTFTAHNGGNVTAASDDVDDDVASMTSAVLCDEGTGNADAELAKPVSSTTAAEIAAMPRGSDHRTPRISPPSFG